MRTLSLTVTQSMHGRTVQQLLQHELLLSDGLITRLKRRPSGIRINGQKAYTTARVAAGDRLTAEIGDLPRADNAPRRPLPYDILFEDDDLIALNKPAGVTVHPDTRRPDEETLETSLCAYLPAADTPHPISRLDRGTTGVILFGKSGYMHERMRRLLHTDAYRRTYLAVAAGVPTAEIGRVTLPIGLAEGSTYQRAVRPDGAESATNYRTLWQNGRIALLQLTPETGRTHQIRVHMAAIGCPLYGDWLYGTADPAGLNRPALHTAQLAFEHPMTKMRITVSAPVPADMQALLSNEGMPNGILP